MKPALSLRVLPLPGSARTLVSLVSLAALMAGALGGCTDGTPASACEGLLPGDVVISEVMANPSGADSGREWVEVYNNTSSDLALAGLELVRSAEDGTGARSHVLTTADMLAAGAYYVLGGVLDAARPTYVNYGYGDALGDLGNTAGRVIVRCGDRVLDEVVYLNTTDGASRGYDGALPPNATANDDTTRWCDSATTFSTGDFGSPGVRNPSCGSTAQGRCSEGGVERDVVPPSEGDLVITELHPNPSAVGDGEGEWFEVLALADVDLNGLELGKVAGTVRVTLSGTECLSVTAGTYLVFGANSDSATNGGLERVDFVADLALSNSGGGLFVGYDGGVLDTFTYTSSGDGASTQLDPRHLSFEENDDEALWCRSTSVYGAGDRGTPGGANEQCMFPIPAGMCDDGGTLRAIVPPVLGDVVITELMPDSGAVSDTNGEWFEVYFASDADLNGLEMGTTLGSVGYRIQQAACLRVVGGTHVLFAKDAAGVNGGLPASAIDYDTLTLGNSATSASPGTLFVGYGGSALDVANWFTSSAGVARSLDAGARDAAQNETESNWCAAAAADTYGLGDRGTPGAPNPACPFVLPAGQCLDAGTPRAIVSPTLGDVVITEVLPDPSAVADPIGEWFELLVNVDVDLNGLQVGSVFGSPGFTLTRDDCVHVTAGTYVLLANNADGGVNGGLPAGAIEHGRSLANDPGALFVGIADTLLDEVTWTNSPTGVSLQLDPSDLDHTSNDAFDTVACDGTTVYGAGDRGTPGAANVACTVTIPPGMCDDGGTPRAIVPPVLGDVVITEIMPDSGAVSDTNGEWFEVYFANAADLNGLEIGTTLGSVAYAVAGPACVRVAGGTHVVFAKDAAGPNGGLPGNAIDYNTLTLGNSATSASPGTLFVGRGGVTLDVAHWFTSSAGVARSLDVNARDASLNETESNWCAAAVTDTYGLGDRGTPGAANPACPVVLPQGQCLDAGSPRPIVSPAVGDVVITEVMPDPSAVGDPGGEWFELLVSRDIDLNGLQVGNVFGSPGFTLTRSDCVRVTAGTFVLLANSANSGTNGGLPAGAIEHGRTLTNDPGSLFVGIANTLLDQVAWTNSPTGVSMQLDPADFDHATNDMFDVVACDGTSPYGSGDRGTPGAVNDACPVVLMPGQCLDAGVPRAIVSPVAGELYINEVMPNPATAESTTEWFELIATADVDLNEVSVSNATQSYPFTAMDCVRVTAGDILLFARSTDPMSNGDVAGVDFIYSSVTMTNDNSTLSISTPSEPLDTVTWGVTMNGRARSLMPGLMDPHLANDTLSNWCNSTTVYGSSTNLNFGTPGVANVCP